MRFSKKEVEDFFEQKVGRAIDQIFTDNRVESMYEFYNCLQDYKKNNTLTLRNTLEHNYDKMLECSELMDKVKAYAEEIKQIGCRISAEISDDEGTAKKRAGLQKGSVTTEIEIKLEKGLYLESMRNANELERKGRDLPMHMSDRYYLKYLKIEVIKRMERFLDSHAMSGKVMQECLECLREFLFRQEGDAYALGASVERMCVEHQMPSILGIVSKKMKQLKQRSFQDEEVTEKCYEIIFEHKLHLLSSNCKGTADSEPFERYFKDLITLISENKNNREFHRIFIQTIPTIKRQLSIIFISRNPTGEIIFDCDLYDHLIKSQTFKDCLQQFHAIMLEGGADIDNPITFIQELWHDYFINLIDFSMEQLHLFTLADKLHIYDKPIEKIPHELRPFLFDHSLENSLSALREFDRKLQLLVKNVSPTMARCTESEKESMRAKFSEKMREMLRRVDDKMGELLENISRETLRRLTLFSFCLCSFLRQIAQINETHLLWDNPVSFQQILSPHKVEQIFLKVFSSDQGTTLKINHSFQNLDEFFMGYLENCSEKKYEHAIKAVIETLCLLILSRVSDMHEGKEKDLIEHTMSSIEEKKEKITVMEYILIPYVASTVCQCAINASKINEVSFRKYCERKPKEQKTGHKVEVEEEEEDFEIGDKEEKEEIVKIGKSLMSMGNNFISGFMPKKK